MDKFLKRQYLKTTIAVLLSIGYTIYVICKSEYSIIDVFLCFLAYGLSLFLAFSVLLKLNKNYDLATKNHSLNIRLLLLFGLVATMAIDRGYAYYDKHNIYIEASQSADLGGCRLILRNNGRYKFDNYFMIAGKYTYGKYRIENDTIYLSTNKPLGEDSSLESDRMLIEGDSIYFIRNDEKHIGFIFRIIQKK